MLTFKSKKSSSMKLNAFDTAFSYTETQWLSELLIDMVLSRKEGNLHD